MLSMNINHITKTANKITIELFKDKEVQGLSLEQLETLKDSALLDNDVFEKIKTILIDKHQDMLLLIFNNLSYNNFKLFDTLDKYKEITFFHYYLHSKFQNPDKPSDFFENTVDFRFRSFDKDNINNEWHIFDLYSSDSIFSNSQTIYQIMKNELNELISKEPFIKKIQNINIVDLSKEASNFYQKNNDDFLIIEYQFIKMLFRFILNDFEKSFDELRELRNINVKV